LGWSLLCWVLGLPLLDLRLEKLLYLELSRSPNGFLKALPDLDGGFTSENAVRRFQKRNGCYETVSEVKRLQIYNGYM
jgi:hypothetical protein